MLWYVILSEQHKINPFIQATTLNCKEDSKYHSYYTVFKF